MQGIVFDLTHCSFKVAKMQEAWILSHCPLPFKKNRVHSEVFGSNLSLAIGISTGLWLLTRLGVHRYKFTSYALIR